jgi:hypothetical protein
MVMTVVVMACPGPQPGDLKTTAGRPLAHREAGNQHEMTACRLAAARSCRQNQKNSLPGAELTASATHGALPQAVQQWFDVN